MGEEELEKRARERLGRTLCGKYRLDALIGLGGMAAVYRASHRNRAQLALKMLHAELSMNLDVRSRFLREGYAANSVQHPGVVLVTDDDVAEDGSAFLVMELLDGASVEELWNRFLRKMPVPIAVDITLQLLDVLAAAHEAGIVHRDIKPANLFVTRAGILKVLDFGIARVLDGATSGPASTGSGIPIGTPAFMAPEQALGRVAEVGPCTDVWAVGATLFTLLSGLTVHDATTAAEALAFAATRHARPLGTVAPDVPAALSSVVDRALAFDPKERWPSASAMAEAVAAIPGSADGAAASRSELAGLFPSRRSSLPEAPITSPRALELESAPTVNAPPLLPISPAAVTELPVSNSRPAVVPPPRRSRRLLALGGALLLALGGAIAWGSLRERSAGPRSNAAGQTSREGGSASGSAEATLVVIPGSGNLTGDTLLDGTLEIVLESALKRSTSLYPYAGSAMRDLVNEIAPEAGGNDEELGRVLGEKRHQRVVMVRPGVGPDGTAYRITLVAKDGATGREVANLNLGASGLDRVVPTVAALACELRAKLGDAPCDPAGAERVGVSASIEADHRYMVGKNAHAAGRYEDAVASLERAIKVDPAFVVAHGVLAASLLNLSRPEESRKHMKLAFAHRDGLSEREARDLSATYHISMDEFDEARDDFLELLRRWPGDTHYRVNLAGCYARLGQLENALESGRLAAEEHHQLLQARANYLTLLLEAGLLDAADQETKAILAGFPRPVASTYACGAATSLLLGHRDAALDLLEKLRAMSPPAAALSDADMAMFEGRLQDAVATLEAGISADEEKKRVPDAEIKRVMLAEAWARLGDMTQARTAALGAAKSNDIVTLLRAGRILARAGAASDAATLERIIAANPGTRAPLFSRIVAADVRFAEHATPKEVAKALGEPGQGPGAWLAHADLGEAYFGLGSFEDAERELRQAVDSRGQGALAFYDGHPTLRYVPAARYWLARAKDALHRPDAQEAYQAFLAAEPAAQGDPLVADAKRRLAAH